MFKTNSILLVHLLREVHDGDMQLPEFQRGWIWDDYRIRDLLTSVAQGFPIGAVMRLDAGGDLNFKAREVEGAPKTDLPPDTFLLDGQQRLTSLYQALMYPGPVETRTSTKRREERWYYVNMIEAIKDNPDLEKVIFSVPKNKKRTTNIGRTVELDLSTPEFEFKNHMMPTECLMEPMDWYLGYSGYWQGKDDSAINIHDSFKHFNNRVVKSFQSFQLPVIDLGKELPREAVCVVFDKVNTGGVPLTTFELLTAILAAENYDLRTDWEQRQTRIRDEIKVLEWIDRDQFIRAVALLVTNDRRKRAAVRGSDQLPTIGCRRTDILSITRSEYEIQADRAEEGFKRAAKFLMLQSIFSPRDIPYATQLTSLATIAAILGGKFDDADIRTKLERWFWAGIFGEVYGGPTETIMANDVSRVPRHLLYNRPLPMLDEVNFEPARLLSMRTRNTAAYKGIHALLMKRLASDWRSNEPISIASYFDENIDIHHIFPRHWCETKSIRLLGAKIPPRIYNCAINKSPLASKTNRIIGGRAPSVYVELLRQHNENVEPAIEKHHIDTRHLKNDQFDDFFIARGKALMTLISEAIGKQLDDGEAVFRNALESANLSVELDDYEDEEEINAIVQAAG